MISSIQRIVRIRLEICILSIVVISIMNYPALAQICRTPSGTRTVIFEPGAYIPAPISCEACTVAAKDQSYLLDCYIQEWNPGDNPDVTLYDFINVTGFDDIGIFFICTHMDSISGVAVEYYDYSSWGYDAREAAYWSYIAEGINQDYIETGEHINHGYYIIVTPAGIQHWCTNFEGSLVFAHGCHSSTLHPY